MELQTDSWCGSRCGVCHRTRRLHSRVIHTPHSKKKRTRALWFSAPRAVLSHRCGTVTWRRGEKGEDDDEVEVQREPKSLSHGQLQEKKADRNVDRVQDPGTGLARAASLG